MNFDFSDDLKQLRDQARRFLTERCGPAVPRRVLDGEATWDEGLWRAIVEMGWTGTAIPETYGGVGLGHEGLCVLAEEMGRAVAPVPFASSVYMATEAILVGGSESQKSAWLPKLAAGEAIGCFALAEGPGNPSPKRIKASVARGKLTGVKAPVADGSVATFAIVAANDESGRPGLYIVGLTGAGVTRTAVTTVDPTRDHATLTFDGAAAEKLAGSADGWAVVERVLNRAAVLFAFEQVGGAQACLDMAKNYAMERYAFGRPIASFQAIKHKLADVYVATELARSNAFYGAWALATDAADLPLAAATARVSATDAFHLASKENIQTHGGMGFTWQFDCHLYYRRARTLASVLGSQPFWRDRLVEGLEARNAA